MLEKVGLLVLGNRVSGVLIGQTKLGTLIVTKVKSGVTLHTLASGSFAGQSSRLLVLGSKVLLGLGGFENAAGLGLHSFYLRRRSRLISSQLVVNFVHNSGSCGLLTEERILELEI
jgi:hypothetical protein